MKEDEIARYLDEMANDRIPGNQELWQSIRTRLDTNAPRLTQPEGTGRGLRFAIVPAITVILVTAVLYIAFGSMAANRTSPVAVVPAATPAPAKALSVDELLDGVQKAERSAISSFHGVMLDEHRGSATSEFTRVRSERWYLAPDKMRYDDTLANEGGQTGKIMTVRNGTSGWLYDSSLRVHKTQLKKYPQGTSSSFVPSVFTSMVGDSATIQAVYDIKLPGSSMVAGRTAQAMELTIKPPTEWPDGLSVTGGFDRVTIWIDSESFYVLKMQIWDKDGKLLSTLSYESFELNKPVDTKVFEISPPEN